MTKVSVDVLQKNWAKYLELIECGETIIVTRADLPVAEVKPLAPACKLRPFGLASGEFVTPDDFDSPLPEEVLTAFEGCR